MTDLAELQDDREPRSSGEQLDDLVALRRIAEALVKSREDGEDSTIELLVTEADLNFIAAWSPERALDILTRLEAADAAVADLLAFDCLTGPVPQEVDVPDDFETGVHAAARIVAYALAGGPR